MASQNPKTIVLKGNPPRDEAVAAAAIAPGELVEFDGNAQLQLHATAGGPSPKMFAVESPYTDPADGAAIDQDWASGDSARYAIGQPGDQFYSFLVAGGSVAAGAYLASDGGGALQGGTVNAVAVALEEVDNSGGGTPARIKVQIV